MNKKKKIENVLLSWHCLISRQNYIILFNMNLFLLLVKNVRL